MVAAAATPRCGISGTSFWLALVFAACSGTPRPEDAAHAPPGRDVAGAGSATGSDTGRGSGLDGRVAYPAGSAAEGQRGSIDASRDPAPGSADGAGSTGDLQIRVVWPDVPAAARRTPCNTPRTPSVAPTTTWGIPDALVIIEGTRATLTTAPATARIALADCTLAPRVAAGARLEITSAVDRPAKLVLRKRGRIDQLEPGEPIAVHLPIAGHTVAAALDGAALYSLETDAAEPEIAFIATAPDAYVTDPSGQLTVHRLTVGPHAVTAWLPPRAGQPPRIARGTATVTAGDLASLTLTLAP